MQGYFPCLLSSVVCCIFRKKLSFLLFFHVIWFYCQSFSKLHFLKVLLLNRSNNRIPQNMMCQLNIVFQLRLFMRSGDHLKNMGRLGPDRWPDRRLFHSVTYLQRFGALNMHDTLLLSLANHPYHRMSGIKTERPLAGQNLVQYCTAAG